MKKKAVYKPIRKGERDRKKEEITKPNNLQFGEMGVSDFQGSFSSSYESLRESTVYKYINTDTHTHTLSYLHMHVNK